MIRQISRFALVGVINTITYYILYLLMRGWIGYLPAHVVAFTLAMTGSFYLNCYFTYRVRPTLRRFVLFPLSNAANFVITTVGVVILVEYAGIGERLAPLLAAVVAIPITFVVARTVLTGRISGDAAFADLARPTSAVGIRWGSHSVLAIVIEFVCAAGVGLVSYAFLLAGRSVWPFGSGSLLQADMKWQYSLFYAWFGRVLRGEESPFFTWSGDLGMNSWPLVTYYLSSPFNVVFGFVGADQVPQAVVVVTAAKLACAAGVMTLALRLLSRATPTAVRIALAAAYPMCTWAVLYGFNLMWLDALYALPAVLIGVELLLRKHLVAPLAAAVAVSVVTNLYIGAMVLVFGGLYFAARCIGTSWFGRRTMWMSVARFASAHLIGLMIGGVLVLPMFAWLRHRAPVPLIDRDSFPVEWSDAAVRMLSGSAEWGFDPGPHLAATCAALVLAGSWFFCRDVSPRLRLAMAGVVVVIVMSLRWSPLYEAWHGFAQPNAWPFRFVFVVPALVTILAAWALGSKDRTGRALGAGVAAVIVLFIAILAGDTSGAVNQRGLIVAVFGAGVSAAACMVLTLGHREARSRPGRIVAHVPSVAVAIVALTLVFEATVSARIAARVIPHDSIESWSSLGTRWDSWASAMEPGPDEFFRADADYGRTHNDAMRYGYYSATHFSSATYGPLHQAARDLGFSTNRYGVWMAYAGSTVVTDALLGVRYLLTREPIDRPGWLTIDGVDTTWLAENEHALTSGWLATSSNVSGATPFERQDQLVGADVFRPVCADVPEPVGASVHRSGERLRVVPDVDVSVYRLSWSCRTTSATQVYAWIDPTYVGTRISIAGADPVRWPTDDRNGTIDLGAMDVGEFTITLDVPSAHRDLPADVVQGADIDVLTERLAQLRESPSTVASHSSGGQLVVDIDAATAGWWVLPAAAMPGWQVVVDGQHRVLRAHGGVFAAVEVEQGRHRIEMAYRPPGLLAGLLVTVGGLMLLIGAAFVDARRLRRNRVVNTAVASRWDVSDHDAISAGIADSHVQPTN